MSGREIIDYNKRVFLDEYRNKDENLTNENLKNKKLKKEYHNIIDIYLRSLFFILSKNKECFIRGAYIINDTSGKLLDILQKLKITSNLFSRYIKNTTHNKYLQNGINLSEIILDKPIINNYCINCATGICNICDIIEYNSIKYYPIIKSKDEDIKYIFLKLETSSTFTLSHALRKLNLLKQEAKIKHETNKTYKTDKSYKIDKSKLSTLNSSFTSKKCATYREDCDRYHECRSREAYLQKHKYELQCKDTANINEKYLKDLEEFEKKHHANITKPNSNNKLHDCNDDSICIKNKILETSNVFFVSEEINNFIFDNCIDKTIPIGGSLVKFNKKLKSRKKYSCNKKCCCSKKCSCNKKCCSTTKSRFSKKSNSYRKKIYNK